MEAILCYISFILLFYVIPLIIFLLDFYHERKSYYKGKTLKELYKDLNDEYKIPILNSLILLLYILILVILLLYRGLGINRFIDNILNYKL